MSDTISCSINLILSFIWCKLCFPYLFHDLPEPRSKNTAIFIFIILTKEVFWQNHIFQVLSFVTSTSCPITQTGAVVGVAVVYQIAQQWPQLYQPGYLPGAILPVPVQVLVAHVVVLVLLVEVRKIYILTWLRLWSIIVGYGNTGRGVSNGGYKIKNIFA